MANTTYQFRQEWRSGENVPGEQLLPADGGMLPDTLPPSSRIQNLFPEQSTADGLKPVERRTDHYDWAFILIVSLLFLVAALKYNYEKRMHGLITSVFSRVAASQMLREYNIINSQLFLPLFLVYVISISIFTYIVIHTYSDNVFIRTIPAWQLMILIFVAHVIFMLLKVFLLNFSGWIFSTKQITHEYIHNLFLFNFFSGIVLLPLILLVLYAHPEIFFFLSLVTVFLIFTARFYRGFIIGLTNTRFSIFHLFLYLCTLEILPLAVIAKFAIMYV